MISSELTIALVPVRFPIWDWSDSAFLVEPAAVSYEKFRGQNVNLTLVCFLERFSHINAMVQFDLLCFDALGSG